MCRSSRCPPCTTGSWRRGSRSACATPLRTLEGTHPEGYIHWGADAGPADTPFEAGLAMTVAMDKPGGFSGPQGPRRRRAASPQLVSILLADPEPLLYHGESVLREGRVIGRVMSGAYGHTLGAAVGLAALEGDPAGDRRCADGRPRRGRDRRPAAGRRASRPVLSTTPTAAAFAEAESPVHGKSQLTPSRGAYDGRMNWRAQPAASLAQGRLDHRPVRRRRRCPPPRRRRDMGTGRRVGGRRRRGRRPDGRVLGVGVAVAVRLPERDTHHDGHQGRHRPSRPVRQRPLPRRRLRRRVRDRRPAGHEARRDGRAQPGHRPDGTRGGRPGVARPPARPRGRYLLVAHAVDAGGQTEASAQTAELRVLAELPPLVPTERARRAAFAWAARRAGDVAVAIIDSRGPPVRLPPSVRRFTTASVVKAMILVDLPAPAPDREPRPCRA